MSSIVDLSALTNQVQKYWGAMWEPRLRQSNLLASFVSKKYEGEIKNQGDTVYISQMTDVSGELLDVGTDADVFHPESLTMGRVSLVTNKRAVASVEVQDLVMLQSQLGAQESAIRDSLMFAISKQINTYLNSLMVASTSAPDHAITSTDMNAAKLSEIRKLAAAAKWPGDKPWIMLCDPVYYSDILDDTTLASSDFNGNVDAPMVSGAPAGLRRFGLNIFEDNSKSTDTATIFYEDALHFAIQQQPTFKLSDLHAQGKFGWILSADIVFGAVAGNQGTSKVITITAS